MSIEIDHSGLGSSYLRTYPDVPAAHEMGATCGYCDVTPATLEDITVMFRPPSGLDVERLAQAITEIDFASDLPASGRRTVSPTTLRRATRYAAAYERLG